MKKTLTPSRRSYNRKRGNYISDDGKSYCYKYWNDEKKVFQTVTLEIGKDGITEEWLDFLDEMDHEDFLSDRYMDDWRDKLWEAKKNRLADKNLPKEEYEGLANALDLPAQESWEPENTLFSEEKEEAPEILLVRKTVKEFTEDQKTLYHQHFGMKLKLVDIGKLEEMRTGKRPKASALDGRKNSMLDKVAKELGVTRVRRHYSSTKK